MLNIEMESLLCDEVLFDTSPKMADDEEADVLVVNVDPSKLLMLCDQTEQEFAEALGFLLEKEVSYMPRSGYVDYVDSNTLVRKGRWKAVCWFIKMQRQLGFSLGTIFNAANYLDRFISNNKCQGSNSWMIELLSIASLSVAAKFNETSTVPLCQFHQRDDLGHCFEWRLIQQMELTLLKAIGWRLTPTTPFSYMEMLISWSIRSMTSSLSNKFIDRVAELLLHALLDIRLMEFRPFAIAISAIRFASEEVIPMYNNAVLQHFNLACKTQDYQDEVLKCQELMSNKQPIEDHQCLLEYYCCNNNTYCRDGGGGGGPTSPVTVLFSAFDDQFNSCCCDGSSKFDASDLIIKTTTQILTCNNLNPSKRMKKEEHPT